jgi:hypothetical protein
LQQKPDEIWLSCAGGGRRRGATGSTACHAAASIPGGPLGRCDQAVADTLLAGKLARPANGFRLFTRLPLGRLLVSLTRLHFAEDAFTLHLLLERPESLVDVVVPDENLQWMSYLEIGLS